MEFRLREILNERGISIRSFAQQMGVVANSLPLSVTYAPSLTSLQKYARVLNIPCVELVRKPEMPTPVTDHDMKDKFDINEMALSNIKRIMSEKQLMLKDVAVGAGMSVQGLSQTLKNNKMSITTLEKIARGLGMEPWILLVDATSYRTTFDPHDSSPIQAVTDAARLNTNGKTLVEKHKNPNSNEFNLIKEEETLNYNKSSVHERDKLIIQALFTDKSEAEKIELIKYAQSLVSKKEEKQESSEDDYLYGDTLSLNGN